MKGCESEGGQNKVDENNKNIKETFFSCSSAVDNFGLIDKVPF